MRPGDETRGWRPGSEASGWRSSNDSSHLNSGNEASRPRSGNEASSQGAGIEASRQRSGNEASVGWGNQAMDWSPFTQPGPSWWCGGQGNQVQGFTPYRMPGYMPFPGPPLQGNHWGQPFSHNRACLKVGVGKSLALWAKPRAGHPIPQDLVLEMK